MASSAPGRRRNAAISQAGDLPSRAIARSMCLPQGGHHDCSTTTNTRRRRADRVGAVLRRGFMTASAAVAAGYTLAAGPVRADVITTSTTASMPATPRSRSPMARCRLFRAAQGRRQSAGRAGRDGDLRPARIHQGRRRGVSPSSARSPSRPIITTARASTSPRSPTSRSFCRSSTPSRTPNFCPISTAPSPGPNRKAATPTGSASSAFAAADGRCGNMPPTSGALKAGVAFYGPPVDRGQSGLAEEPDPARARHEGAGARPLRRGRHRHPGRDRSKR